MDDGQTMRSMVRDDAYVVERVLADGPSGRTEIVYLDGEGPLVRKRIPLSLANASAWAVAMESSEPLLPRIESLYRMPDVLVVVYDYVPGDSLAEVVERGGVLSPKRSVEVIADVCRAVAALHEHGVVHRDIAPGNVILAGDGAHLVDLGIARQHVEGRQRDTTALGTWGFASPEQYGFAQTDARSDVYALGKLLGYMLTGLRPDASDFEAALDDAALVPEKLAEVVHVATAFEPSQRYQRAEDLATAARVALEAGRETPVGEPAQRPAQAARTPGKFSEASVPIRIAALCAWAILVFFSAVNIKVCWDSLLTGDPPWKAGEFSMSTVSILASLAVIVEIYRSLTRAGAYAEEPRPRTLLVKNALATLALYIVALVACALILPV